MRRLTFKSFNTVLGLIYFMMKGWVINNRLYFIGAAAGAVAGYFYWRFVGCHNGQCMISGKPLNSTVYFAFLGVLVSSLFKKKKS